MKSEVQPIKSFKNNLKQMFLMYSLVPVIGLVIFAMIFVLVLGGVFVTHSNKSTNQVIKEQMEQTFLSYEELLADLSVMADIVDPQTSLTKRQRIVRQLYQTSIETGYKAELYIVDRDFRICVSTDSEVSGSLNDQVDKHWSILRRLEEGADRIQVEVKSIGSNPRFYMGQVVMEQEQAIGYIVISFPAGEFTSLLSNHKQHNILVDATGWIFAADNDSFTDAVGRLISGLESKRSFFTYQGGVYYLSLYPVYGEALKLYTIAELTDAVVILLTVMGSSIVVLFIVFVTALMRAEKMAEKSTRDICLLNDGFKQVMAGDMNAYLDMKSSTEFENIGRCYNKMLNSLKNQIAANKELAETVAYAQVKQLESQFNSHFLFNTLDNIRFMCKIDAGLAEYMTISLSELLRYNTSNANEKVTVAEDLRHIQIYLEIIHVRFQEWFDYEINMAEGVSELLLPKLLLQPLIENAIKYGFGNREHLNLRLTGFIDGENLCFICQDDGIGIEAELLAKLQHNLSLPENESTHLGLYNVHRRLHKMDAETMKTALLTQAEIQVQNLYVKKAVSYVREHYAGAITITDVAEWLNLSEAYFCRLFKKESGYTFGQYVTNYRIHVAAGLLTNFPLKVNEVAAQVGFIDSNYFSITFKKIMEMSPSEYQELKRVY